MELNALNRNEGVDIHDIPNIPDMPDIPHSPFMINIEIFQMFLVIPELSWMKLNGADWS